MFTVVSHACVQGSSVNEDALTYGADFGIVIDGATGLNGIHLTSGESDAAWMSSRLAGLLSQELAESSAGTADVVRHCAARIRDELVGFGYDADDPDAFPSACVSIVRLLDDALECYVLGDSPLYVQMKDRDGGYVELYDRSVPNRDGAIVARMKELSRTENCSVREALAFVGDSLRKNRSERNTEGAYWVFDPTGTGADRALVERFKLDEVKSVTLMTDGYYDVFDTFGIVGSVDELLAAEEPKDVDALLARMVEAAGSDPDFSRYPRFKQMDDATVLRLRVGD